MSANIQKFAFCITSYFVTCFTGHSYEQDNWYLAWEVDYDDVRGAAFYENEATGVQEIYAVSASSDDIRVFDINGTLKRTITIASARHQPKDIVLDENGTIYLVESYAVTCLENDGTFKWRTGKNSSVSSYGDSGNGDGEFYIPWGIALGPDENLYISDAYNRRVQVLDKSGSFLRKFGSEGSAPGQFQTDQSDLAVSGDGYIFVSNYYSTQKFDLNGTFVSQSSGSRYVTTSKDGMVLLSGADGQTAAKTLNFDHSFSFDIYNGDSRTENFRIESTPDGGLLVSTRSYSNKLEFWKRAYRTKGSSPENVIPQPSIRSISQRAGTNIIDLDFEIIDSDDSYSTVGIIAHCGDEKVVPQTWVDGTGSKINSSITTNQLHRVSWDVKQDWATSTGTIKFEILCQDQRTNKPVDLHFLTLPFPDGNMTISRSPLKDSDFQNYAKYLLAKGDAQFESNSSTAVTYSGSEILTNSWGVTTECRTALLNALGSNYRWATSAEISKAREAGTPGIVNSWTPVRPVRKRNLPGSINEYGFDVSTTSGYWVIKE